MIESEYFILKKRIQKNIPEIIKCARNFRGMGQRELAQSLGVSQGSISKFEAGRLVPDSSEWVVICQILDIDVNSTESGFIDFGVSSSWKYRMNDSTKAIKAAFLHNQYRSNCSLNVRFLKPVLNYAEQAFSETELKKKFRDLKVDPSYFIRLDLQVNEEFSNNLSEVMNIDETVFQSSKFKDVFWDKRSHGTMLSQLEPKRDVPFSSIKAFVKRSTHYNCLFDYSIKEESKNKIIIKSVSKVNNSTFTEMYNKYFLNQILQKGLSQSFDYDYSKNGNKCYSVIKI